MTLRPSSRSTPTTSCGLGSFEEAQRTAIGKAILAELIVRSFVIARLERDEDVDAVDRRGTRIAVKCLESDGSLNSR